MAKHQPFSLFQRYLYLMYYHGGAIAHFFKLRIRPLGALIIMFTPICWILMPLHNSAPLWQVRGVLFILPIISLTWLIFRKGKISLSRELPRTITAGKNLTYQVTVRNLAKRTIHSAHLLEIPTDNRPSLDNFWHSREPGEESRNLFDRKLSFYRWQWLERLLTLFRSEASKSLEPIPSNSESHCSLSLTPLKRGIIVLNDARLCLPDPLGLFQRCIKTKADHDKIIVLPRCYEVRDLRLSDTTQLQLEGETASNAIGIAGDFTSIREYKPGDAMKHIHWKSWARTGKPIVKEYEDIFSPRYGLLLDTFGAAENAHLFEEAVSVAASYVANTKTTDSILASMFIKDQAYGINADQGEEKTSYLLETLADVQYEPQYYLEALEKLVIQHQSEITTCLCIFTGWSERHQLMINRLCQNHLNLKIFAVCSTDDYQKNKQLSSISPVNVQWLRLGSIQADLLTSSF
ncbi:MAG: DUF58 domain-containing protein [Akkermansiaceae bacterium]